MTLSFGSLPKTQPSNHSPGDSAKPPKLKKFWAWRDLPSFMWLVLAVLCAIGHRWLPEPRWLLIHLILLGAASHAILVWSQHFSCALLHSPVTVQDRTRQSWRLGLFNVGVVLVFTGVLSTLWLVTLCGAALISVAVLWHAISLLTRFRMAIGVRFAVTIWFYVAAAAALPVGATIGVLLAHGFADPLHGQLKTGHALLNVLGWIGLTVVGTLVTLWPTMLRTKLHPKAVATARRVLWVFVAGLVLAAASVLWGSLWGTALGLLVYLVALCWLGSVFVRSARQKLPSAFCALSVAAGMCWMVFAVGFLLVGFTRGALISDGWDVAYSSFTAIAPFFAAGFVVQVLIGALAYLIPVMVSSGPASARAANAEMERGSVFRIVATNLSLAGSMLPVPSVVLVLLTMVYLGTTASFLVLMVRSMRAAKRPQLPTIKQVPAPLTAPATAALNAPSPSGSSSAISGALSRTSLPLASAASTAKPCCDACAEPVASTNTSTSTSTVASDSDEGVSPKGEPSTTHTSPAPALNNSGKQDLSDKGSTFKGMNPNGATRIGSASGQAVSALLTVLLAIGIGIAVDPASLGTLALGTAPTPETGSSISEPIASDGFTTPKKTLKVEAREMEFYPNNLTVDAGTDLTIELTNTDATNIHDLVFENGISTGRIAASETEVIQLGIISTDINGWCSILGHKQMGMTLSITVNGATDTNAAPQSGVSNAVGDSSKINESHGSGIHNEAVTSGAPSASEDLNFAAAPGANFKARDARLPQLPANTGQPVTHKLEFEITEQEMEIAPGVTQMLWTFNGQFPGPTLHGRVGDVFEIELVNNGSMGHSIDFHASNLAPDRPMRTIAPGERLTYAFTAERAGIWMYHCGTMPMTGHIANGMAGAVIIEPDSLPDVDHSYVIVQSEMYLGAQGQPVNMDKALKGASELDAVVFNGYVNQYVTDPLETRVGERVRIWTLDVGPSQTSSFHVVGGQFDRVWFEGEYTLGSSSAPAAGNHGGSQALAMQPAQGGFVELVFPEKGTYPFVTHIMADAERGAKGLFRVSD